jgi:hypothetical protein
MSLCARHCFVKILRLQTMVFGFYSLSVSFRELRMLAADQMSKVRSLYSGRPQSLIFDLAIAVAVIRDRQALDV